MQLPDTKQRRKAGEKIVVQRSLVDWESGGASQKEEGREPAIGMNRKNRIRHQSKRLCSFG